MSWRSRNKAESLRDTSGRITFTCASASRQNSRCRASLGLSKARAPSQSHETSWVGGGTSPGRNFWARGYFVSTVGLDEVVVREYIRNQEKEDKRLEQLNLDWSSKELD